MNILIFLAVGVTLRITPGRRFRYEASRFRYEASERHSRLSNYFPFIMETGLIDVEHCAPHR